MFITVQLWSGCSRVARPTGHPRKDIFGDSIRFLMISPVRSGTFTAGSQQTEIKKCNREHSSLCEQTQRSLGSSRCILHPSKFPPPPTAPATQSFLPHLDTSHIPSLVTWAGCFGTGHAGQPRQGAQTSTEQPIPQNIKKLGTFLASPLCGIWSMLQKVAAGGDKDHTRLISLGNQAGRSRKMNHIQRVPAARLLSLANLTYG